METKQASMGVDDNCPIQPPNNAPHSVTLCLCLPLGMRPCKG